MMRKRGIGFLGISYLLIGVIFLLSGFSGVTGFAIAGGIGIASGFLFYFGIVFLVIGALILTTQVREKESKLVDIWEAHSAVQYDKLKKEYNFIQGQGTNPADPKEWIVRYHAYDKSKGFDGGYINQHKLSDGFYMADEKKRAKEQVEMHGGLDFRNIGCVKIKFAKGVYQGLTEAIHTGTEKGAIIERIPADKEKIRKVNDLIRRGLVVIESA